MIPISDGKAVVHKVRWRNQSQEDLSKLFELALRLAFKR
jgi:hypothetical protein